MYIPLWNRSNYTLLSSLLKIDDIISKLCGEVSEEKKRSSYMERYAIAVEINESKKN